MRDGLSDVTQKDWIRAVQKLGFVVNCKVGKGSHCIAKHGSRPELRLTLVYNTYRVVNIKVFRQLEKWGFGKDEINAALP